MIERYNFAGVELTPESVQAARQWYHDNAKAIIAESGDRDGFWQRAADSALTIGKPGGERVSVAFLQKAHFIQTGESIALLP